MKLIKKEVLLLLIFFPESQEKNLRIEPTTVQSRYFNHHRRRLNKK